MRHAPVVRQDGCLCRSVAVEVGFEPTEDLRLHTLSRRAPSATRRLHRGRAYRTYPASLACLRWAKKSRSRAPHSPASTPPSTSVRCGSRRSRSTSHSDPAAPALGSAAPYTRRAIRAATSAPAHMVQGSSVTTSVCPSSRHRPAAAAAARSATISACAVGSRCSSRWLWARATTLPRSEEHTSELQSRPHLVCRLLLEKKKKKP